MYLCINVYTHISIKYMHINICICAHTQMCTHIHAHTDIEGKGGYAQQGIAYN